MSERSGTAVGRRGFLAITAASIAAMMGASLPSVVKAQGSAAKSDPRYAYIDRVADLVLPSTDTPGASAAGVAAFVLLALDSRLGKLEPANWTAVSEALDAAARAPFLRLPRERQTQFLSALDQVAFDGKAPAAGAGAAAWPSIKAAIVAGYYCSEIGATQELIFDPVPGAFANISLTPEFRNRSIDGFGEGL